MIRKKAGARLSLIFNARIILLIVLMIVLSFGVYFLVNWLVNFM